uniref:Uncharacterized protein n=1 Tax=Strigamia maritima TaxID=126957 RepID=T1JJU8_STRMM
MANNPARLIFDFHFKNLNILIIIDQIPSHHFQIKFSNNKFPRTQQTVDHLRPHIINQDDLITIKTNCNKKIAGHPVYDSELHVRLLFTGQNSDPLVRQLK